MDGSPLKINTFLKEIVEFLEELHEFPKEVNQFHKRRDKFLLIFRPVWAVGPWNPPVRCAIAARYMALMA